MNEENDELSVEVLNSETNDEKSASSDEESESSIAPPNKASKLSNGSTPAWQRRLHINLPNLPMRGMFQPTI